MNYKSATANNMGIEQGEPVSRKVADALHERLDHAADAGAKMERTLHEKTAQAQEQARKIGANVSKTARDLNNDFGRVAKNYPWAVAGAAIAIGFLIGALSRNR